MERPIGEAARISGVSVRTLRYYDEIGLLKPSGVSAAGYRFYDDEALERLQRILLYRELDFSLGQIAVLLRGESCPADAFRRQRSLLVLQRERLDRLIRLLDARLKGESPMEFKPFDKTELERTRDQYEAEARERWGGTDAYRESARRRAARSDEEESAIGAELDAIFTRAAALRGQPPESAEAQALVEDWRAYLTRNYYDCTPEILRGLGEMYVADARFAETLDRYGEGTASLLSRAIAVYCDR